MKYFSFEWQAPRVRLLRAILIVASFAAGFGLSAVSWQAAVAGLVIVSILYAAGMSRLRRVADRLGKRNNTAVRQQAEDSSSQLRQRAYDLACQCRPLLPSGVDAYDLIDCTLAFRTFDSTTIDVFVFPPEAVDEARDKLPQDSTVLAEHFRLSVNLAIWAEAFVVIGIRATEQGHYLVLIPEHPPMWQRLYEVDDRELDLVLSNMQAGNRLHPLINRLERCLDELQEAPE